ncbi:hypothetical protein [Flammeovirga aprica]|uniref:Uncharacterized protein n=1 Tax=Flammeovirga aprica JL-4 TaxID=694437 RepID=A0A7X9XC20_9BACT|nr:hypothetical protein [Flammeovirga aprica]NME71336.1 hypothetical protein [Flammeovirga aprica JL-4]
MKNYAIVLLLLFKLQVVFGTHISEDLLRVVDTKNKEEKYYLEFWKKRKEFKGQVSPMEGLYKFKRTHSIEKEGTIERISFCIPVYYDGTDFPWVDISFLDYKTKLFEIEEQKNVDKTRSLFWLKVTIENYVTSLDPISEGLKWNEIIFKFNADFRIKEVESFNGGHIDYLNSWKEERENNVALPTAVQFVQSNIFETEKYYIIDFVYLSPFTLKKHYNTISFYNRSFSLKPIFRGESSTKEHYYFVQVKVYKSKIPDLQMIYLPDRKVLL